MTVAIGLAGSMVLSVHFFQLGSFLKRFFRSGDEIRDGFFCYAFGMIFFLVYVLMVGSAGFLTRPVILGFIGLVLALRFHTLTLWFEWHRKLARALSPKLTAEFGLSLLLLLIAGLTYILCFVPETGNDALCYQLSVPKYFVWQRSVWPVPYDVNSYIPMAMNCLYAVGLLFGSVMIAKFCHWLTAILTVLLLIRLLCEDSVSRKVALACAALYFLTPAVMNEMTTTYVDIATGFFMLVAVVLFVDGFRRDRGAFIFLAGLAMSMAIATKFSLLILLFPMLVLGCFLAFRFRSGRRTIQFMFLFTLGAALICGFWFIRNYGLVKNPFFPYFGEFFGTIGMTNYGTYLNPGIPKTIPNLLLLPWHLTVNPDVFGRGHWLGPMSFLMVPAVIAAVIKRRGIPFVIFAVLGTVLWFYTTQASRYLLPLLPAWYLVTGYGAASLFSWSHAHRIVRTVAVGVFLAVLVLLSAISAYHFRYEFLFLTRQWSQDRYLESLERTWPIACWINGNLPASSRVFNVEEVRAFYFDRDLVRERNFNFFTSYSDHRTAGQVLEYLKGHNFTHILLSSLREGPAAQPAAIESRILKIREIVRDPAKARRVVAIESKNIREAKYGYELYELL